MSSGARLRGSITSTEMPLAASSSAAASAFVTMCEMPTTVTSVPARRTLAHAEGQDLVGVRRRGPDL